MFTKQALRLTHIAIGPIVNNQYGNLTSQQLITATEQVPEVLRPINPAIIKEEHQLIQGIISVSIKRNNSLSSLRIDQENDFLICVELFSRAIDTYPDDSDVHQINERISWDTVTCDILNLDITSNDQAKMYIALAKHYGLRAPNEIFGMDITSGELYRNLNRQLPKEPLSSPLYKAGVTYLILMSEGDIAGCYGGLLFLLAFSLSRTANFRSQSWGRRFTEVQRQLLVGNMLLNSLSEGSAREMSILIDTKIRDGLDPDALSGEIRSIVNQSFSHVHQLIAVTGQVEYKGLAPI